MCETAKEAKDTEIHYSSTQHPLPHINTVISISTDHRAGVNSVSYAPDRGHPGQACCGVPHRESVLLSAPGSLNHHDQKVNTVHESITWGGEIKAPRDPGVSLIQTTNLSDSQIIGVLLDSVEKEIFTLIIHFVHGCISSPSVLQRVRPHS